MINNHDNYNLDLSHLDLCEMWFIIDSVMWLHNQENKTLTVFMLPDALRCFF